MSVCACVHARLGECMRTDTWRSPSLAAHIVEGSLPVWAILYLSFSHFFPFLLPPFIFCPLSLSLLLLLFLLFFFPLRVPLQSLFCLGSPYYGAGFLLPGQTRRSTDKGEDESGQEDGCMGGCIDGWEDLMDVHFVYECREW